MFRSRLILTGLWWGWGLALFVLLAILSSQKQIFGDAANQAWGWFLPNIVPAMTLMGAVAYTTPREPVRADVRRPLLMLALLASVAYLALLSIALCSPFYTAAPIDAMLSSNLWLAPLQALTLSTVGVFFTQKAEA